MLIVESSSLDVHRNLALEEYLMDEVRDTGPILFLWRSKCAVVMGKNQNPWKECRLDLMDQDGVLLARRLSGGGTVYHDEGNLNYCVITDRESYKEEQAYQIVFKALEVFGLNAERTGKSNLSVDGFKFSGNAFAFRKGRAMHHGTLLLDTDLERLARYLGSMLNGIETHAIPSVPADVANLRLPLDELVEVLKGQFLALYADGSSVLAKTDQDLDAGRYAQVLERQRSEEWMYGATPAFSVERGGVVYKVVKGRVVQGGDINKLFKNLAISWVC